MKKNISILAGFIVLTFVILASVNTSGVQADAWGPYKYYNLTSANASSTASTLVRGGAGVLGSVTIASSSAATTAGLKIYDGTATSTGTLIGTFKVSSAEQTFNLDFSVAKGIVVDVPVGFSGSFILGIQ